MVVIGCLTQISMPNEVAIKAVRENPSHYENKTVKITGMLSRVLSYSDGWSGWQVFQEGAAKDPESFYYLPAKVKNEPTSKQQNSLLKITGTISSERACNCLKNYYSFGRVSTSACGYYGGICKEDLGPFYYLNIEKIEIA